MGLGPAESFPCIAEGDGEEVLRRPPLLHRQNDGVCFGGDGGHVVMVAGGERRVDAERAVVEEDDEGEFPGRVGWLRHEDSCGESRVG